MKSKPVIFSFLICLSCLLSVTVFAQPDSGGGSECPISYSFKKNNGGGNCGGDALISVIFNPMPLSANIPRLTAIYYKGQPLGNKLPVQGYLVTKAAETNISYCITETGPKKIGFSNISPAGKLILEFTYTDGTTCRTHIVN
ncbi:MAG TPA: hypothetical protein VMY77_17195 [Chitinophagaceae bacterium]|nr:hypothetical protein [Chitinophagaceae bacterium]